MGNCVAKVQDKVADHSTGQGGATGKEKTKGKARDVQRAPGSFTVRSAGLACSHPLLGTRPFLHRRFGCTTSSSRGQSTLRVAANAVAYSPTYRAGIKPPAPRLF